VIKHTEKQFQKHFVPGKSTAIDESSVGFKHKIILKIYNPEKPTKWVIRLFELAESNTYYVHSIIQSYGKHTGNECNTPYLEKPFISGTVLLDGQTRTQCVWY
jgi:hypothetical protein